jgi:hypothetical protein
MLEIREPAAGWLLLETQRFLEPGAGSLAHIPIHRQDDRITEAIN